MDADRRAGYDGSGPGEITPDGCAVELYKRLPVGDEPEIIAAAVPPPARLLELGCGAGRVTRALVAKGYDVTAVDESAAMVAHVDGAAKVRSSIEDLVLPGTFDVVVLGSFLVHAGDPAVRAALLATCRRYVDYDGQVLIQREGSDWHDRVPRESRMATASPAWSPRRTLATACGPCGWSTSSRTPAGPTRSGPGRSPSGSSSRPCPVRGCSSSAI
jgi:SAM-dependent methyltransferase